MQLTQYNLDLFQPIKAENLALISSNWKTHQKAFLGPFPASEFSWKTSSLTYQDIKKLHRRPFRAKFGCFQKIPIDSQMFPFFPDP